MIKILLTSDITVSLIAKSLQKRLEQEIIAQTFQVIEGDFNNWFQQLLVEDSILNNQCPQYWIHIWSPRSVTDNIYINEQLTSFLGHLNTQTSKTNILVTNFIADPLLPCPLTESHRIDEIVQGLNARLLDYQSSHSNFSILPLAPIFTTYGTQVLSDVRYEALAKTYFSIKGTELVTELLFRGLRSQIIPPKKVLVLDLDNTLWRGVIGEDGLDGIELGQDGDGYYFYRFQKALLQLKERGILLAICSKNNEDEALNVINNHSSMILRISDFASYRINWKSKSENIIEIATELNVGIDSLVFFDDSPHERETVKKMVPQVCVIDVPREPELYVEALNKTYYFDSTKTSSEDKNRTKLYQDEQKRKQLQEKSLSLENYYLSLNQRATITNVSLKTYERALQLINKTNQFNLTSRRFDASQFQQITENPNFLVLMLAVEDDLGESGHSGLAIIRKEKEVWHVEDFLLSCRVIGRTVEFSFLRAIIKHAKNCGANLLHLYINPNERNNVAQEFITKTGFVRTENSTTQQWSRDLTIREDHMPKDYLKMKVIL